MKSVIPIPSSESTKLLELIYNAISCVTIDDVKTLVNQLSYLINFDAAIFTVVSAVPADNISSYEFINVSYSLESPDLNSNYFTNINIKEHFLHNSVKYWNNLYEEYDFSSNCKYGVERNQQEGIYSCGLMKYLRSEVYLLSVDGDKYKDNRSEFVFNVISPHIHHAYFRVIYESKIAKPAISGPAISPRETEILNWVKQGKSSWDISVIVGISERTVKFHLKNIFTKLNAGTRAQAVAIALSQNLIY